MIESVEMKDDDKDSHTLHDLKDYAFSREVIKDHPKIIKIYDKLLPVLYQYAQYQCVWPLIQMVEDSKVLAAMQLKYYSNIYKNKGEVPDGSKTEKSSR